MNVAQEADGLSFKDFNPFHFFRIDSILDAARLKPPPEIIARAGDEYLSGHPSQTGMNDEFAESICGDGRNGVRRRRARCGWASQRRRSQSFLACRQIPEWAPGAFSAFPALPSFSRLSQLRCGIAGSMLAQEEFRSVAGAP